MLIWYIYAGSLVKNKIEDNFQNISDKGIVSYDLSILIKSAKRALNIPIFLWCIRCLKT
jgi:hypothetical protein